MTVNMLAFTHVGRRRLPFSSGPRLVLTTGALIANGLLHSAVVSGVLTVLAISLLAADRVEIKRLWLYGWALFSVAVSIVAGKLAGLGNGELVQLAARMIAGVAWLAWVGSTSRWFEIRDLCERAGLGMAADILETALAHGQLLVDEAQRAKEAMVVRHASHRYRFQNAGWLFAKALERALLRVGALDEAGRLRSALQAPAVKPHSPAIELLGLSVQGSCGTRRIKNVNLALNPGQWLAVAGPSGSGKTTLLKAIAGLATPCGGQVFRFGNLVHSLKLSERVDRRVGLVFQDPDDQLFGTTPADDLAWGLRHRGIQRLQADTRGRMVLESLGIGSLADRAIHELSFGERKRVAFAAMLALEPEILLCDEPTMGLDPVSAARLVSALQTVASPGPAVIWATHDLGSLPLTVDRLVLLSHGSVVFTGSREEGLSPARLKQAGLVP